MKKKILFIIPSLTGGGAEKVLIDILQNMDYSRYEMTLFLEFRTGPYLKDIPAPVTVHAVHGNGDVRFERTWNFFKKIHLFFLLKKLSLYGLFHKWFYKPVFTRFLKGQEFDTITSFMEGVSVKYHSYIVDKAKRNLSWVHIDLEKKHWSLVFFQNAKEELKCYRKMDNLICVSEDVKQSVENLYPSLSDKCTVVYNLIDRDKIIRLAENQHVQKKKLTICMVGRLNQQKRYDRALEAARRLKQDGYDIDFWILGQGELLPSLKRTAKEYGLEDSFLFLGFVKSPYSYMKAADIYLNTSEAEGFSLTVCEAFCLGLPVVSTATAGPKELIGQSGGGLLTGEDINSIYHGIRQMADDELLRKRCSEKALDYSNKFDVMATMEQIYRLI